MSIHCLPKGKLQITDNMTWHTKSQFCQTNLEEQLNYQLPVVTGFFFAMNDCSQQQGHCTIWNSNRAKLNKRDE